MHQEKKGQIETALDERYLRNIGPLSPEACVLLAEKKFFLAGCGGLGGYAAELLCRMGVGNLTIADGDAFTRSNLNRQLMATERTLGMRKPDAAKERLRSVNPDVAVTAVHAFLTPENAPALIAGHDVVIDALDQPAGKCMLERCCERCGIPLVHGAADGWNGQVTVVFPGDRLLETLYSGKALPAEQATLSFSPAAVAAVQAAEAVKLLLGRGSPLRGRLLLIDLLTMEIRVVRIKR